MAKTDLADLRVLLVGGRTGYVQVLRTAFSLLGMRRISGVQDGARAVEMLRSQSFHAVFCDADIGKVGKLSFAAAARQTPGILNPMTPLFLVCSLARRRHVEQARDAGVTDVLTHPVSAATIARKLEAAIASPRPFIAAPAFFGPDRRTAQRSSGWHGEDRRKRTARKARLAKPDAADPTYV